MLWTHQSVIRKLRVQRWIDSLARSVAVTGWFVHSCFAPWDEQLGTEMLIPRITGMQYWLSWNGTPPLKDISFWLCIGLVPWKDLALTQYFQKCQFWKRSDRPVIHSQNVEVTDLWILNNEPVISVAGFVKPCNCALWQVCTAWVYHSERDWWGIPLTPF